VMYVLAIVGFAAMISLSFVDPPQSGDRERKVQIWDMHKKAPPRVLPMIDSTGLPITFAPGVGRK